MKNGQRHANWCGANIDGECDCKETFDARHENFCGVNERGSECDCGEELSREWDEKEKRDAKYGTLDELFNAMKAGQLMESGQWPSDLPVFGGNEPDDTAEVWSWDESRLIVGTCADDLAIVDRARLAAKQATATVPDQPIYTDCLNCGTANHQDYDCPCGCHGADYNLVQSQGYPEGLDKEGQTCPACGHEADYRECDECSKAGWVIDCEHYAQPRPIAPLDHRMFCDECFKEWEYEQP